VGFAFAAATGGFLADLDFSILFFVDAATMAAFALLVWRYVPETKPATPPKTVESAPPSRSWIRDGDFVIYVGITLIMFLLPLQTAAPLSAHMAWQGFSATGYGLVL